MPGFNDNIITEFRANHGKVGGPFEGANMILITTTGPKTGRKYTSPLVYWEGSTGLVLAASNGGSDKHPSWFGHLRSDPKLTAEIGDETFEAVARIPEGAERDELWEEHKRLMPGFADYEKATDRVIPIVVVERAG